MIEIRAVHPAVAGPLGDFFAALVDGGDDAWFHPHPLTREHAVKIAASAGRDLYYVVIDGEVVLGYGLLRGWDEGYDVPSLGIAISRDARGAGLASMLMGFLHAAARRQGARRVRLRVSPENTRALQLYTKLGYSFPGEERGEKVGVLEL